MESMAQFANKGGQNEIVSNSVDLYLYSQIFDAEIKDKNFIVYIILEFCSFIMT